MVSMSRSAVNSMRSSMKQYYNTKNAPSFWAKQLYLLTAVTIAGTIVFFAVYLSSSSSSSSFTAKRNNKTLLLSKANVENPAAASAVSVVTIATDEAGGISYYHCQGQQQSPSTITTTITIEESNNEEIPLVLLHGAKFSKQDWNQPSGILEDFCSRKTNKRRLSVFAAGTFVC
jgi:hypothetical protein